MRSSWSEQRNNVFEDFLDRRLVVPAQIYGNECVAELLDTSRVGIPPSLYAWFLHAVSPFDGESISVIRLCDINAAQRVDFIILDTVAEPEDGL